MSIEYFEARERALLGDRYDQLYTPPEAEAARGITVSALRAGPDQLAARADFALEPSPFCGAGFVVKEPGFKPGRHPYHHAGVFYSQEPSASSAAPLLGVRPGMRVLDLCAAPGGKTLLLAQQMGDKGRLLSFDAAQNRLPLIETAARRCGLSCVTVGQGDASAYDPALAGADRVLCDVPCSGLGIIAKKPDIRYKSLEGCEQLHALQLKILTNAARYVKEGGRLVYSTCTVDVRENGQVVRAFLEKTPGFRLLPPPVVLEGALIEDNMQTMLPGFAGPDGFFAAVLERV